MNIVFLDCDNKVLACRFAEAMRRHPLCEDRPVMDGILLERQLLEPLKQRVGLMIVTSNTTTGVLCALIQGHFRLANALGLSVLVVFFAYRLGLPREADLVFDVRFLANQYYVDKLRPLTRRLIEAGHQPVVRHRDVDQGQPGNLANF